MKGCLKASPSGTAMERASASMVPPGGNGTTILTGFVGYSAALTVLEMQSVSAVTNENSRRVALLMPISANIDLNSESIRKNIHRAQRLCTCLELFGKPRIDLGDITADTTFDQRDRSFVRCRRDCFALLAIERETGVVHDFLQRVARVNRLEAKASRRPIEGKITETGDERAGSSGPINIRRAGAGGRDEIDFRDQRSPGVRVAKQDDIG